MDRKELISRVKGNIVPLPALYNDDLSISLDKMKSHLEFLLENDVKNIYLALSASEFERMTKAERLQITDMVVKRVNGKAVVLGQPVCGMWFDEQAQEAKEMIDLGVDVLVVKMVDLKDSQKFFSAKYTRNGYIPKYYDDFFIDCYRKIGDISKGYIISHDKPFRSFGLLDKLVELECIVGIKTHEEDPWKRRGIYERYGKDFICFDGMGKTNQFWSLLWGASGRHTCWSWFDPQTDHVFTKAVQDGRLEEATAIVNNEWPIIDAVLKTGFYGYKTIMGLVGLPTSGVRIPGESISAEEKEMLRQAVIDCGLLKAETVNS